LDLASGTIRLEAGTTKNGEGRVARMTREVATLLTDCIIGKQPDDFVFTRPDKKRKDGTSKGGPVEGFRKVWETVCCSSGVGKRVCRLCHDEAKREGKESGVEIVIPPPVGAKSLCPTCGTTCKKGSQLKYVGLIFHDLRRSGVRNLRRLGVQESIAMRISGHKTRAVFERYNIVDESDLANAASRLDAKQNAAAVEVNRDFGHDRGELHQNRGRCADAACNCCSA
jgi:hypothetical protein